MPGPVAQNPIREYMPSEFWNRWFDFFVYSMDLNPLVASAVNQRGQFVVDSDSDFLTLSLAVVETQTPAFATEVTFPPVLVQLQDTGSGANWFDNPQHIANVFGRNAVNGPGPTACDVPRWIAANATVTGQFQNLEATDRRLMLAFRGVKVYRTMRRNYPA